MIILAYEPDRKKKNLYLEILTFHPWNKIIFKTIKKISLICIDLSSNISINS